VSTAARQEQSEKAFGQEEMSAFRGKGDGWGGAEQSRPKNRERIRGNRLFQEAEVQLGGIKSDGKSGGR